MWGKICIMSKSLPWTLYARVYVCACDFQYFSLFWHFNFIPFTFLHIFLYCFLTFHIFYYRYLVDVCPGSLSPAFIFPLEHTSLFPSITCPSFVFIQNWIFKSFNAVCSNIMFSASPGIYRLLLVTALFLSITFDFMIAGQCPHVRNHAELCT